MYSLLQLDTMEAQLKTAKTELEAANEKIQFLEIENSELQLKQDYYKSELDRVQNESRESQMSSTFIEVRLP